MRDIFKETLDKVGPKAKILQLGCGNSQLTLDMYNNWFEDITCIDIGEVVIKKMSFKYPLKFVQMDISNLEFGEEKFDLVIEKSTLDGGCFASLLGTWTAQVTNTYIKHCCAVVELAIPFMYKQEVDDGQQKEIRVPGRSRHCEQDRWEG